MVDEETEELLFEFDLRKPPRIASTLQVKHSMGVRDASAGFLREISSLSIAPNLCLGIEALPSIT